MSTTFEVYPAVAEPPRFSEVMALARRRLTQFADEFRLGAVPPIRCTIHDSDEHITEIVESAQMVWPRDHYAWFEFGKVPGGTDAYCRELAPDDLEMWDEQIATHEPARLLASHVRRCLSTRRWWYFRRSAGQPAVVNLGYGFLAAALAETTDGFIYSDDSAWEYAKFPCKAEDFYHFYFRPDRTHERDCREWAERNIAALREAGMQA